MQLRDTRGHLAVRADGPPYRRRALDAIVGVAVHATAADMSAESLALYQSTKLEGDPYPAIAYHYVLRPDGSVEWCHDLAVETWHAGVRGSAAYVALCFAGAGGETPATPAQLAAAAELLALLEQQLGRPLEVRPHHELLPSANGCPGPSWPEWRDALTPRDGAAPGEGVGGPVDLIPAGKE